MYPALAVLQALEEIAETSQPPFEVQTLWVGGINGMEVDLVKREGINFEGIPAAGVHGVGVSALPGNLLQLSKGYQASRKILSHYQPDVLFFTGGYVAVPMATAGRSVPSLLYVPDIEPGLALKTLARFADRIAVTADESRAYFSDDRKVLVSGYPTRPDLLDWTKEDAREALGLAGDKPVLLVFGGSKGARSINRALLSVINQLLEEMEIVHITGLLDWEEVRQAATALPAELAPGYHAFPYLHRRMGAALRAADLVLSRAGASTLGEFPAFALPAILVPYPHAWRYQRVNAEYLAQHGAALVIEDQDLLDQILSQVRALMRDRERLERMRQEMGSLARLDAAEKIAYQLLEMGAGTRQERM